MIHNSIIISKLSIWLTAGNVWAKSNTRFHYKQNYFLLYKTLILRISFEIKLFLILEKTLNQIKKISHMLNFVFLPFLGFTGFYC